MLLTMMSETVWKDFQRIFENKQGGSDEIGGSNGLKIENSNEMTDSSGDTSSPVSGLSIETLTKLKHGAWLGSYFSKGIRGLCWRIMLGKLSYHGLSSWKQEIPAQIVKYENMKETILPDINRFHDEHDPLSEGSDSGEWAQYYKVRI